MTTPSLGQIEVIGSRITVGTSTGQDIIIQDPCKILFSVSPEEALREPQRAFEQISKAVKGHVQQFLGIFLPPDPGNFPISFKFLCKGGIVIPGNHAIGLVAPGGTKIDTSEHPHIITIGSTVQR